MLCWFYLGAHILSYVKTPPKKHRFVDLAGLFGGCVREVLEVLVEDVWAGSCDMFSIVLLGGTFRGD